MINLYHIEKSHTAYVKIVTNLKLNYWGHIVKLECGERRGIFVNVQKKLSILFNR